MVEKLTFWQRCHPLYWLLITILFVMKWAPKAIVSWFAEMLGRVVPLLAKRDSRLVRSNIHRVMNLPPHSDFSKMFARQVLRHQVFSFFETLKEIVSPGSIQVEGFAEYKTVIQECRASGQGIIIFTGHLGSWELVARYGAMATDASFYALAKPSKHSFFTRFLDYLRPKMKAKILWTNRPSLLRDMIVALKNNHLLGFVMDQRPDLRVGHEVDFLGQKTAFVSGPARLALKSGADPIGIFCVRQGPWQYKIICEKVCVDQADEQAEKILTQRMAELISQNVKLYPEQWVWNYKRWASPT